jgi:hypothetical protein
MLLTTPLKRRLLLLTPPLLMISTIICFHFATAQFGQKAGYFIGFLFYWVFWCLTIPVVLVGWPAIKASFVRMPDRMSHFSGTEKMLLAAPLLLGYGYAFPRAIGAANFLVIASSLLLAITNAACEEYPLLGYLQGHIYPAAPTFGLPCPTTIFTFGILLWTDKKLPVITLVIPFLWSLIGFSAAFSLGIREDTGLLIAGLLTTIMILIWNKRISKHGGYSSAHHYDEPEPARTKRPVKK